MLLARRLAATALLILIVGGVGVRAARQGEPGRGGAAGQTLDRPARIAPADTLDAEETRRQLMDLLRKHPPALGRVLKTDPSLLTNEAYLAPYPGMAAFLAEHPEVARNPAYFFEHVPGMEDGQPRDARMMAMDIWRNMFDGLAVFVVLLTVTLALAWLVKTLLDWRRWTRMARAQAEVHAKLLDRFTANEDLLSYIQTPAGRRFLESGPVLAESGPRPLGAPVSRILWSFQAGIVLTAAGIGLAFVSYRVLLPEVADGLSVMGVLAIALGLGFAISGVAAWAISRRMGLFEPMTPSREPNNA